MIKIIQKSINSLNIKYNNLLMWYYPFRQVHLSKYFNIFTLIFKYSLIVHAIFLTGVIFNLYDISFTSVCNSYIEYIITVKDSVIESIINFLSSFISNTSTLEVIQTKDVITNPIIDIVPITEVKDVIPATEVKNVNLLDIQDKLRDSYMKPKDPGTTPDLNSNGFNLSQIITSPYFYVPVIIIGGMISIYYYSENITQYLINHGYINNTTLPKLDEPELNNFKTPISDNSPGSINHYFKDSPLIDPNQLASSPTDSVGSAGSSVGSNDSQRTVRNIIIPK